MIDKLHLIMYTHLLWFCTSTVNWYLTNQPSSRHSQLRCRCKQWESPVDWDWAGHFVTRNMIVKRRVSIAMVYIYTWYITISCCSILSQGTLKTRDDHVMSYCLWHPASFLAHHGLPGVTHGLPGLPVVVVSWDFRHWSLLCKIIHFKPMFVGGVVG